MDFHFLVETALKVLCPEKNKTGLQNYLLFASAIASQDNKSG